MDASYKKNHMILLIVQAFFILLGLINAVFQTFLHFGDKVDVSVSNFATYGLSFFTFTFILIYAMWGYAHSIVPYRLAMYGFYTTTLVKLLRIQLAGQEGGTWTKIAVPLMVITLLLVVLFDCTFKKYKQFAIVTGLLLVAVTLALGIAEIVTHAGMSTPDILSLQPLSAFLITSAIVSTYLSRCHWSKNGKIDLIDGEV